MNQKNQLFFQPLPETGMIYWVLGLAKCQVVVLVLEKSPFSMGMGLLSRYSREQQISVGLLVCAGFAWGSTSPRLLLGLVLGPRAALAVPGSCITPQSWYFLDKDIRKCDTGLGKQDRRGDHVCFAGREIIWLQVFANSLCSCPRPQQK